METLSNHEQRSPSEVKNELLRILSEPSSLYTRNYLLQILEQKFGAQSPGENTYERVLNYLVMSRLVKVVHGLYISNRV